MASACSSLTGGRTHGRLPVLVPQPGEGLAAGIRGRAANDARRQPLQRHSGFRLEIDLRRHKATRQSRRLDLTPKEFQILWLLAYRYGDVVSRREIAEEIWDMHFETGTNFIEVHIRRLRSKVDDPFEKKLIHTVRGFGYVLEER